MASPSRNLSWAKAFLGKTGTVGRAVVIIVFLLIAAFGYGYRSVAGTAFGEDLKYVTARATRGTFVVSVSAEGRVVPIAQTNVRPISSGQIVRVYVKNGQRVRVGEALVALDQSDALLAVRNAEIALERTRLQEKVVNKPPDSAAVSVAENTLAKSRQSRDLARTQSVAAIEAIAVAAGGVVSEMSDALRGMDAILNSTTLTKDGSSNAAALSALISAAPVSGNFGKAATVSAAQDFLKRAHSLFGDVESSWRTLRKSNPPEVQKSFLDNLSLAADELAEAEKNLELALDIAAAGVTQTLPPPALSIGTVFLESRTLGEFINRVFKPESLSSSTLSDYRASVRVWRDGTNSGRAAIASLKNSIASTEHAEALANASVADAEKNLETVSRGYTSEEKDMARIDAASRENALAAARNDAARMVIRAAESGIVSGLSANVGDIVSPANPLLLIMSPQLAAEILLNESDMPKIAAGQKATVIFDAIPGLSLVGDVAEIDLRGEQIGGVTVYRAMITFAEVDRRVIPSMNASAEIVSRVKTGALAVPSAAVRESGNRSVVRVVDPSSVRSRSETGVETDRSAHEVFVTVGATNDTAIEIMSGLNEGDEIVLRKIEIKIK